MRKRARRDLEAKRTGAVQPMTVGAATRRYWEEVGQHHKASDTTLRDLLDDGTGENRQQDRFRLHLPRSAGAQGAGRMGGRRVAANHAVGVEDDVAARPEPA